MKMFKTSVAQTARLPSDFGVVDVLAAVASIAIEAGTVACAGGVVFPFPFPFALPPPLPLPFPLPGGIMTAFTFVQLMHITFRSHPVLHTTVNVAFGLALMMVSADSSLDSSLPNNRSVSCSNRSWQI